MAEGLDKILSDTESSMNKAINHLEAELVKIRAGKANPTMLDGIMADYYGSPTAINQIANVSVLDARTISVQPWEKNMLGNIEKAIQAANLGFNPQNDGVIIRISVPPLTEERRKDLVKQAKVEAENCRVSLRSFRRDGNEKIKKYIKDGLPEDAGKQAETDIQNTLNDFSANVDKHLELKEKEIDEVPG